MSLANTVSILLDFKTDLSGLSRFTSALRERLEQVGEFNKRLQNGGAALNQALQMASGYLAAGQIKSYVAEALQAGTAQNKLAQALRQTRQDSADYRTELAAQSAVQQKLTGLQDEVIAGVQRQLVFAGVQRKDVADLTALTLDFASAKEIDGVSAAKAVGRALQGEGDELARYGVRVDASKEKVAGLIEGLGKFRGQAGQAFAALPEGLREFQLAAKDAKQSAGEGILALASPFLSGVAEGLGAINGKLSAMREQGSALLSLGSGLSRTLGSVVGANLDKLAVAAAALLALKAGSYAASQGLAVLASGFLALTGTGLAPMLARLAPIVQRFGLLATIAAGGWPAALAAGLALVGGALATLAVGSVVINSVEAAQLARLGREQKIRDAVYDQTRALQQQAGKVRSLGDVANVQKAWADKLAQTRAEISALEAAEAKDAARMKTLAKGGGSADALAFAPTQFSADDAGKLDALRVVEGMQASMVAKLATPDFQQKLIARNRDKDDADFAKEQAKRFDEAANRKLKLELRAFDLETQIAQARAAGNIADEEAASRELATLKLRQELVNAPGADPATMRQAEAAIQTRLDTEAAAREQKRAAERRDQLQKIDGTRQLAALELEIREAEDAGNLARADQRRDELLEKQLRAELTAATVDDAVRLAEVNELIADRIALERRQREQTRERQAEERALEARLGEIADARALLEGNRYLSAEQKRKTNLLLLRDENTALDARIARLQEERETAKPERAGQIDQQVEGYRRTRAGNLGQIEQNQPQTFGQGLQQGVNGQGGFLDSLGTSASNAADAVKGTLNSALSSTSDLLYNLASGSMTFSQAWGQATLAVGQQFLRMATDMVAKMIWRATVERALIALGVMTHVGGEAAKTGATVTGGGIRLGVKIKEALADVYAGAVGAFRALVSIPYVGPVLGAVAMAAALAGGLALVSKIGHFESGGVVAGGRQIIQVNENGQEAVLNARALQTFGPDFVASLNAGALDLSALPGNIARQAAPAAGSNGLRAAAGSPRAEVATAPQQVQIAIAPLDTNAMINQWMESTQGRRFLLNLQRGTVREV